jgi:regulation of enolase protein 1 (concanavalin A-like superfamily)
MQWLNEPPQFADENGRVTVLAAPRTDFWRVTHDGGVRDTGHFYYQTVRGDFTAEVQFSGEYRDLYDQAGLMLRVDETTWVKCGVEFTDGRQNASVVVTRDFSDWSIVPLPDDPPALWLRVKRHGVTVEVSYSLDGTAYTMLRQAYFTDRPEIQVGLMVAAPTGEGFTARFEGFTVTPLEGEA